MINNLIVNKNKDLFRYERKFIITQHEKYYIDELIKNHPAMFSEIYHKRSVNNIYFDTHNMQNFYDNKCGNNQRMKPRIRWYGNLFSYIKKPVLELKIKEGHVGTKKSFSLNPFTLDSNTSHKSIFEILNLSNIPDLVRETLKLMEMKVITSYSRRYFQSADKKYRLTIDWDLRYYGIENVQNTFMNKSYDSRTTILELKYSSDNDSKAEIITNHFPFRFTKNSKYEIGIDRLLKYR